MQHKFISDEERKLILAKRYQELADTLKAANAEPSQSMKEIVRIFVEDSQEFKEKNQPKQADV